MAGESSERSRLIARIEKTEQHIQQAAMRHGTLGELPPDLTIQQLRLLGILAALGAHSSHELAEAMGVGATTLTGIVDRLETKGYVHRWLDTDDRRIRRVDLTEQGVAMLGALSEVKRDHHHRVLARVGNDDLRKLAQGLEALARAFEVDTEA